MGEQLKSRTVSIRDLVTFGGDEELSEERSEARARKLLKQIGSIQKALVVVQKLETKLSGILKRDRKKYRRAKWKTLRARIALSREIRSIEFTEAVSRRMIEPIKESVETVQRVQRELNSVTRQIALKKKRGRLKEDVRKELMRRQRDIRAALREPVSYTHLTLPTKA